MNGLKIQWGYKEVNNTNNENTIAFSITYTQKPFCIISRTCTDFLTSTVNGDVFPKTLTTSGFKTRGYNSPLRWFSIGD